MKQQKAYKVVRHFGGIERVDEGLIEALFGKVFGEGFNEFIISDEHEEYPRLVVLAKGKDAAVYYFPQEGHAGYASVNDDASRESEGFEVFRTNGLTEDLFVPISAVIPMDKAKILAAQFLSSTSLPTAVDWLEL